MAFLTDQILATGVTLNDLIHIVITGDTSQNPAGSSYKATIGQVLSNVITGTTTNIYNSDGSLTGNRTVNQGSFDLDFIGDENSRFQTFYTSTINPSDNGGITVDVNSTNISHNDDTNDIFFAAGLFPGNSAMNVGVISTNESAGISFNSSEVSIYHYDGVTTTRGVRANINGIIINQQYYLPNADGTNGQVLTTDGVGNTSWQQIPISSFTGGTVSGETIFTGGLSATTISATTIGSPTDCVDDLYVSNIHSCSPLNINPLDEGNVYFGSTSAVTIDLTNNRVGIGTGSPTSKLNISGSTGFLNYDSDGVLDASRQSYLKVSTPSASATTAMVVNSGNYSLEFLIIGTGTTTTYGSSGDSVIYASSLVKNLNIINGIGPGPDNIRFYAGQIVSTGTTPDLHIQGNGATRGYVGIGTESPSEKLDVSGKTKTTNFQMTSGATSGYVLTSDASGNASWQNLYGYQYFTAVTITSAQTLSIGSIPVQILPAPGTNKYYDFKVLFEYVFNTTAYSSTGTLVLVDNTTKRVTNQFDIHFQPTSRVLVSDMNCQNQLTTLNSQIDFTTSNVLFRISTTDCFKSWIGLRIGRVSLRPF